jgi:hypothetical protein
MASACNESKDGQSKDGQATFDHEIVVRARELE